MMLWFNRKFTPASGATLFEILIVLTILALTMSAFVGTRSAPSQRLEKQRQISAIIAEAASIRQRAIATNQTITFPSEYVHCDAKDQTRFFSDGTATPEYLCLIINEVQINLKVDPVTGILQDMSAL